jgi:5-formyltetrahydrofolate cyclo-ligase
MTKDELRGAIKDKLKAQAPEARWKKSRAIEEKLFALPELKKAKTVCFFVSLETEVDTHGMIDRALMEKKKVLVPLTDMAARALLLYEIQDRADHLQRGTMGIWEPDPAKTRKAEPNEIDVIIVPGLAFDAAGNRLGRGRGFYDRFLGKLGQHVPKVAIAFSFQKISEVPVGPHDVKVYKVLKYKILGRSVFKEKNALDYFS